MLDVAAVAQAWLVTNKPNIPGLPAGEGFWPSVVSLIALHDIGKFSRSFQAKREDLWPSCLGEFKNHLKPSHDTAGFNLLNESPFADMLEPLFGPMLPVDRDYLLRAVCGHHGSPPLDDDQHSHSYCSVSRAAAKDFIKDLFELLSPVALPNMTLEEVTAFSWWLAGFTVLADWIGSAEDWFPYPVTQTSLAEYWPVAQRRALKAVREAGLNVIEANALSPLSSLLGDNPPTPAQAYVESIYLGAASAPALVIIEDQTGSGKTEAALILAHRLMAEKRAHGIFIALPTMATANALHGRLSLQYRALFAADTQPSLVLAHGKSKLNERFSEALRRGEDLAQKPDDYADETASAQCAAWIGKDRRRSFLADVGVGTIDQALHGVLPTRHAPLRMFGLSQRVLIIDEAHAYDAYMQEELFQLVEFQARLGGSTIILSATLPLKDRQKLVSRFSKASQRTTLPCQSLAYPLITSVTSDGITEHPVAPRENLSREIYIHRVSDTASAIEIIQSAAAKNAAVGWIRNTVNDAIAAQTALAERGVRADLFHARFAIGDRLDIEARVQQKIGKSSVPRERAYVVVGTQVMEQSLDIDFDVLITDLAPIDLMLQRAGRLWRHQRDHRPVESACLYVLSPEPVAAPPVDWLKDQRGTGFVYEDHGILWRSAEVLFTAPILHLPGDVRRLVELVYGTEAKQVPDNLQKRADIAESKKAAARAMGRQALLKWDEGYSQSGGAWASEEHIPTRLSEPSFTYRLAFWEHGAIQPCCADSDPMRAWALSETSIPVRLVTSLPPETGARAAALSRLRAGWNRWEQEIGVLLLEPDETGWRGSVVDRQGKPQAVHYSRERGLEYL
ncbi:MAG: hypothetical protein B7Z80_13680 [Rhodospirillales bacterium 20-64-7]|nr:MAG: hypothetical protein B7Z80_13680 [Rhodospirillales bacterium 20-64-7]